MNYGFVKPTFEPDQYILGSIVSPVINESGDWTVFLPSYEPQFNAQYDTAGCTVWGTQNALETFEAFLSDRKPNYSERYTYILAGVRPPGADPHTIIETIRHKGLIEDSDLPFTESFTEFLKPDPMDKSLLYKGQLWLDKWDIGHEWLWKSDISQEQKLIKIKDALTKGTVCISVSAWFKNDKGLYYSPKGQENTHWSECYKVDDIGIYVFDSYDQSHKILTLDHDIQFAKRYNMKAKTIKQQNENILFRFLAILKDYLSILKRGTGEVISGIYTKRN